jgi:tRNA-2-methylthio-N6-dimethylallyladenosine synthase
LEKNQTFIGKNMELLVEGHGRQANQMSGRGRNLKIVNFDGPKDLLGQLVQTTITEVWPVSLLGRLNQ